MLELDLSAKVFADKVYGCWLGKNAGGTLGAPLEELFGAAQPFDVSWYPELRAGGIPNDDLEMQLVWLLALEEVGPGLRARDLAHYWLDHIGYNFDEYGMSKANLRLGLEPPLSGFHNNWFKDCMGCPIRSEIWACVAPGMPRVAVRYAYEDAICDHAGGESVFGEMFNAALESAAFVVDDRRMLVDIGLSYVPPDSKTAQAIRAAITAHANGEDWKQARQRVLDATPHPIAQYSPINLGFQVIGLLYGKDFGDAICTTVNCGYDTDSSGAAIGSYLGILSGRSGLPAKWTDPLGDTIATNESWGGVRHLSHTVPSTLDELTERIRAVAVRVLGTDLVRTTEAELYADEPVRELWHASPTTVRFAEVAVDYLDGPVAYANGTKEVRTVLRNHRRESVRLVCALRVPDQWKTVATQELELAAGAEHALTWRIETPDRSGLADSNRLFLEVRPQDGPQPPAVPIVLIGACAYRVNGTHELYGAGNEIPLPATFEGTLHLETFVHSPNAREAWLAVDANCPVRFWVNGELIASAQRYRHIRPDHRGSPDSAGRISLRSGWNEVRIELTRGPDTPPAECHVLFASNDRFRSALTELGRTRFPWDLSH
ncbi:ADP-ribosylglycohydrolase family protein [Allorhizocola rhizosphaerae]|uniref:ADP-ribosylglycohydrolase family protein n=1 Tax=Allorhizocola rhizosphaerae TaxID=1872709 RepID=UPI000E3D6928|nr:ADP-ribosylglycohydrolase family protein [Allorhizocola rhizosphaerae]